MALDPSEAGFFSFFAGFFKNHGIKELSYILFTESVWALKSITECRVDPIRMDPDCFGKLDPDPLWRKAGSRSALKVKFRSLGGSKGPGGRERSQWRLVCSKWNCGVSVDHSRFVSL